MNMLKKNVAGGIACCLIFTMAGCQTYGEGAGAGATLGAIAGGVIGHQSGRALEGAAIGAAIGGLAGLIAHDIKVQRAKSRQQTMEQYQYEPAPDRGELLKLEEYYVSPSVAAPGSRIAASLQYAILGPGNSTPVTETRRLMQGDKVIADLSSETFTRQDGTWLTTQDFSLPNNLRPGEYVLVQRVETPQSSVFGAARFTVR